MFRVDRRPRGEDRWLYLKLACFGLGAALALLGMALKRDILITIAIGILALGFLLRFLRKDPAEDGAGEE